MRLREGEQHLEILKRWNIKIQRKEEEKDNMRKSNGRRKFVLKRGDGRITLFTT